MRLKSLGLLVMICSFMLLFAGPLRRSFWLNWANLLALSNAFSSSSPDAATLFTGLEFENKPTGPSIPMDPNELVSRPMIAAEFKARHYTAVLQQADVLLSQNSSDRSVLVLKGDTLWIMHETLPAIEAWKQAGFYQRLLNAAQFLIREKQFPLAQAAWEAAIKVDSDNWQAWIGLGSMYWDQGDTGAAKRIFESMVARNSKSMGNLPYVYLGIIYAEEGLFDDANRVLELGLDLWPQDIPIRTSQGIALARGGKEKQAIVILKQVLLDEPMNRDACYWIGWAYAHLGDDKQAIDQYTICLERFPQDVSIQYELGVAFMRQGRIVEAREEFLRILEIDPAFQRAKDRLLELERLP